MSAADFKPPSGQRITDDALRLEDSLRQLAKTLGLRIKVTYDEVNFGYLIDSTLIPERATYTLDEEVLVWQPSGSTAIADLLHEALRELQHLLHDQTAKAMTARDTGGRQYGLSKEDKHLLHDMLMDAINERMRDFSRAATNHKKVDEYQALIGRLFR